MPSPKSVFHELELPNADALVIKSILMSAITGRIRSSGLNQTQAAAALGMPRTEVSHLMRGRISRFTIDRLVRALQSLDGTVRVRVVLEQGEPRTISKEAPLCVNEEKAMSTRHARVLELAESLKEQFESRNHGPHVVVPTAAHFRRWAEKQVHAKEMAASKDTSVIPTGLYCYGTSPCGVSGICPYWSNPLNPDLDLAAPSNATRPLPLGDDRSRWFAHCAFLEVDSDYRTTPDEGQDTPLIWDQVKECGQNPEPSAHRR